MYTNNKLAKSIRLALMFGGASVALSSTANAQEESTGEEAAQERIQVTGSRISRTDYESSSPVQITSAEEIKLSGYTRIEDLMNSLPQVEASQTSFIANGASGVANLDLRGMGANRTLVLMNGRRLQPGGVYSQAPDVNQIPSALVKRVEVLTGGGSATYGADAVAGVVNFVMDDDFSGLELVVGGSGYQHDNDNEYIQGLMDDRNFVYPTGNSGIDGKAFNIDLTMGGDFADGKGHATAYATWRTIDELRQESRDYSSCALNSAGTACGGSGTTPNPNFYFYPSVDGTPDYSQQVFWTLDPNSNFIPSEGNVYNYAPVNHFMRPDERYTLGAFVDYEVNENFRPYMEISYMHNRTKAQIAESGIFYNFFSFDIDNPLFSDSQRQQFRDQFGAGTEEVSAYIGKRNVEGGPRASVLEHSSYRLVAGSEGYLGDAWSYDVSFQYGSTSSSSVYINDFFTPRIGEAIGAIGSNDCVDPCIPYEVFTFNGVTAEQADPIKGTGILNGVTTQRVFNAFATGEFDYSIPSSSYPIAAVIGVENREVDFERTSDEVFAQGLLAGQGGPTPSLTGGYNVREVFGELSVPLLDNATAVDSLTLELGGRYSDYNTSGGETAYKVAIDYNPTADWKVRASFNRAVRAPNIAELFAQQSLGLWQGTDPCAGSDPELSQAACANTGVTAAQYGNVSTSPASQYNGFFGGNPNLDPEIADTLTFGVVGNPIENLNFSVDYFNIDLEEVIGTISPELTITQCGETGLAVFCDNIQRSATGNLWQGDENRVTATNINLATRTVSGVDVSANYQIDDVLGGTVNAKMIGSYSLEKEYNPIPGVESAVYDCSGLISVDCFPQPDWRHSLTVSYASDADWTANVKWRYFGGVDYDGTTDQLVADGLGSQSYIDLNGAFDVTENVSFLIGVNNVLDKEAPMVGSSLATNANTVAGFYDTLGRYLHASVTFRF
ncbi:TonB-dependent Receptor Plug Domain [Pseudidiomarina planktonica]|uniref:TonB-dependent Receptor Plug Domain n=1 Tax=Pseudidiomarina planktonica TaxID=1323738 RepID=A0A1Y6EH70_9GAMM|nr:TonB-dependent receptor [Pseudidiomarina planktonica]RUO65897.1 TonB-dependent receptor [Pseudidiomarina planktonica]SMQ61965.1 TonB-dependent Receptor Plug Domain [Pseudidiomarina planktonica]